MKTQRPEPDSPSGHPSRRGPFVPVGIDWEGLVDSLDRVGKMLLSESSDIVDGFSAEDLTSEVILKFFRSEDALRWQPERAPLDSFLSGVLKNVYRDRLRRQARVRSGTTADRVLSELTDKSDSADAVIEQVQAVENARKMVSRPSEKKLIDASQDIDGSKDVNKQLAEAMDTTVREVQNLKRTVRRKLGGPSSFQENKLGPRRIGGVE